MTDWLAPLDIAAKVFNRTPLTDWRGVTITATLLAESGGNPRAVGKPVQVLVNGIPTWTVAFGLGQLLGAYHVDRPPVPSLPRLTITDCFDPDINWERVWWLLNFQRVGWSYNLGWWSATKPGPNGEPPAYQKYVPQALAAARSLGATI